MKIALSIALILSALLGLRAHAGEPPAAQVDVAIGSAVARLKAKMADPRGIEYPKFRHLASLDLDGDGSGYLVAAFSIESGESNAVYRYLGVWRQVVGALLVERSVVELDTVALGIPTGPPSLTADRRLRIPSVRYVKGDSRCCPSLRGEMMFKLAADQLVGEAAP